MDALARANEIRLRRSEAKRDLTIPKLIALVGFPPWWLEGMAVLKLLLAVPGMGPRRSMLMLDQLRISHRKTVGGLSARQRGVLIDALAARVVRR